jgi:hypothetical protein
MRTSPFKLWLVIGLQTQALLCPQRDLPTANLNRHTGSFAMLMPKSDSSASAIMYSFKSLICLDLQMDPCLHWISSRTGSLAGLDCKNITLQANLAGLLRGGFFSAKLEMEHN